MMRKFYTFIFVFFWVGITNGYSFDTLQTDTVNYSSFFNYSIEEIEVVHMGGGGNGPVKEVQLKKNYDIELFNKINSCLTSIFKDTAHLKTSRKSEINITALDIDSFMINNPYYPDENGEPDEEKTYWMKDFKQKYLLLSEKKFQQILTGAAQISHDTKHLNISFVNSNNESLTLFLDNPFSPYFLPWVINYKSSDLEAHNINITNCIQPILKETNWRHNFKWEKEHFINCFIAAMYHFEKEASK
jgi:hypothetical protein